MEEKNDNWFGSWLSAAKNKSTEVLEFVKKDLGELGNVVKHEATNVVNSTSSAIGKTLRLDEPESTANSMKRSISSILGQMNQVLNPSPDDSDTEAIMIIEDSETVTLTKLQKAIYTLQKNDNTFLSDPDISLQKQYNCWLEIVDDEMWSQERIIRHLSSSIILKNQYDMHVPTNVSHTLFWKRYLFKKALIEDDIARQEALERREIKDEHISEENVKWDQEDFAKDIELTEEQQIKLLEQYEEETKQKSLQQNTVENKNKTPVGENVIFEQKEIKKSKINISKKNKGKQAENIKPIEKKTPEKEMSKSTSLISLETSSSKSSTDDDWEKISDTDK